MSKIGVVHPGEMGTSVAASAIHSGHQVHWASEGRSDKTHRRAEKHHLIKIETLFELCQTTEIIFSVCPPHAAEGVAKSVIETGFKGLYLDANAISPQRWRKMISTLLMVESLAARRGRRMRPGSIYLAGMQIGLPSAL